MPSYSISSTSASPEEEEVQQRQRIKWSNKFEFILSCIGLSVGIGNVWRYPYVAYENGGGTFQIPYVILLIFVGFPLYYLEIIRGQFSQYGALGVWHSCPVGIGIGWGMMITVTIGMMYYNVIIAYTLLYMILSFAKQLPWATCSEWWGADENCYVRSKVTRNLTAVNVTRCGNTSIPQTSAKQFWEKFVLRIDASEGVEHLGGAQWRLVLALAGTWLIIFLAVFNGIRTSGKAVYLTATLPYVILIALLIQSMLLDGAIEGLAYFFNPRWEKLLDINVWFAAAQQMVYSLSLANGGLITLASYNHFHNKLNRDALQVTLMDFITSLMASTVVFSVIGSLAKDLGVHEDTIFESGQGLAFVVFPEVVTRLPIPQLWSFLFFLMLFTLGVDSTFASVEAVWAAVFDDRPYLMKYQRRIYFLSTIALFLCGLIYCTAGGQYILNFVDRYSLMGRTVLIAWEVMAVTWIYGLNQFCEDVKSMIGSRPNLFMQLCWKYICPVVIIILTVTSWMKFSKPTYGCYEYPIWIHVIGWAISLSIILQPPGWAIYVVYKHWKQGDWRSAFAPDDNWNAREYESDKEDQTTTSL